MHGGVQRIEEWEEESESEEGVEGESGSDRGAREEETTHIGAVAVTDA